MLAVFLKKLFLGLCTSILIIFLIGNFVIPKVFHKQMPFRFYHVLTNSMEPLISPNSLVCVRAYDPEVKLKKNEIITFRAKRFGENIIITHRYSHSEVNSDGEIIYRTHPEKSDVMDIYDTTAQDILGTYVFHLPFGGNILLFLKSIFGILWICEMITIVLIRKLISARWLEKQEEDHRITSM